MTITIELTPEEEKRLRDKAARQGQKPAGVVHGLVHQGLFAPATPNQPPVSERLTKPSSSGGWRWA